MPNFKYKARDKFGKAIIGTTTAEDGNSAAKKLQDMGYILISVDQMHELKADSFIAGFKRVKPEELGAFTRQLFSMQKAGLPLVDSLEAIAEQTKNRYFSLVIQEIAGSIRGGISFSESLRAHQRIFNEIYTSMIKAAEAGGSLTGILERLTKLLEREIDTTSRVKAATRYPLLAFFALCLGFLVLVAFVVPRFAVIYAQFKTSLPLPTLILIVVSQVVRKFWFLFILGGIGSIFAFKRFIESAAGRPLWDGFKLKVPVLGPLVTMLVMSRFARITSILMKSGVPILEVLDLAAKTSGNVIIARAIAHIKESVNQGRGMSEPMKVSKLFPPTVIQMVATGEKTGRVDDLLESVADYYDEESGYMIRNLSTYIEPILIFVLGVMVLIMALAIFLPWWNLIKLFRH